ncbi:PP2C family protein-serine/threonine phosphatase [Occultella gossypii]|uniref:Protein phosphatase 2C domain-containing protein n=1 Tax=Occultella gossypii TaxID=2800820 RepID=A0ABS7SEA1_9MICO|nr:protein phosphatase 2C domain-containing protein [Occultella gossypii]MBZ2198690.1 protein phosphatase 2C domain-containing protein [Occultella gossypii]
MSFRYAVQTDLGTVRTNNEDSALGSPRLLVLADGMGGHAAGEVASSVAVRVFAEVEHSPGTDIPTQFLNAGRASRHALQGMSEADAMLESMGTTLIAVASDGEQLTIGHIGDSRVYCLHEGSLYQVTTDHTHVQRLIDQGQLTPERARTHPYRSMLLRSLDDQPGGADLDIIALTVSPGDRLLLCSDGLSDYLSAEHIGELLTRPDPAEAARGLINAALVLGTRDNVTVVVADVVTEPDVDTDPLDAAPVFAGAVTDGITLSPDAGAALSESLPTMIIDPTSPAAGAHVRTPRPATAGSTGPVGVDVDSDDGVTLLDSPTAAGDDLGDLHPADDETGPDHDRAAADSSPDASPGESDEPRVATPAVARSFEPPATTTSDMSMLPGILAGSAVLILAALLWIILG